MLVIARKTGQSIIIGGKVEILVIEIRGDQVRLGIEAPKDVPVYRKELLDNNEMGNIPFAQFQEEKKLTGAICVSKE